jgi:8-oxo-dGTP pyrophosphatase MutT (NUDIX family)
MRTIEERLLHRDRWLQLKEAVYLDLHGSKRSWVYAERTGGRPAVVVVARTRDSGSLLVIEQYRVPFQAPVLEFPAGLLDPGEEPPAAALRELSEETGYRGEVLEMGPAVCTTAGLSSETVHLVYVRCGEKPEQASAPEASESIRVLKIPPSEFAAALARFTAEGRLLDAKLYVYLKEATC